jgi:hypothetical protein
MTDNPFATKVLAPTSGAMATAMESREIQEVQAAMVIAQRFPRDERRAMDRILNACTRKTLAETALYSYNRGGQEVTGPSIRLAEVLAQAWGNIQSGVRELEQTDEASVVEVFAWDLETNTRDAKVFRVPHVRHTKSGAKKLTDPRDIYENVANVGARRKRACILAIIPGDVTEAAVSQCDVTLAANADTGPDAVQRLLDAFAAISVTKAQIEARITNRVESIRPAQMIALRKIYASIRDGISGPDDWFAAGTSSVDVLADIKAAAKPHETAATHGAATTQAARSEAAQEPQEAAASAEWPKDYHGNLYDSRGVVWDGVVHSGAKSCNADGTWRRRKGVAPDSVLAAESRYPRIDPLTTFGRGPAIQSAPAPLDLAPPSDVPTFADALTWIETAQDLDQLNSALDAARSIDMDQSGREALDAAAAAQAGLIRESERHD